MAPADETKGTALIALRAGVLFSCAELLLARISDVPQWPRDIAFSLVFVPLGTLATAGLARLVPWPAGWRDRALAAGVALPIAALAGAIPGVRLRNEDPTLAVGLAAGLFVAILLAAFATARVGRSGGLSPAVVVGGVAAAAAATWAATEAPPPQVWLVLAAGWTLLLVLSRTTPGWIAATCAVVVIASMPFELRAGVPETERSDPVPDGPDLVMIVADTLRADEARSMRTYQELASHGVAYTQVQAAGSWTLPSVATLMTGVPVSRHGAGRKPGPGRHVVGVSDALPTLAEQLHEAGYDTGAILAMNPYLNPHYGLARGFDHYELGGAVHHAGALPASHDFVARPVLVQMLITAAYRIERPALHRILALDRRQGLQLELAYARDWLERRSERPYFLWLHAMEAHLPYDHVLDLALPGDLERALIQANRPGILDDPRFESAEWRDALRRAYRNEVAHLDRLLLELLDALGPPRPRGRVVVLVADHGEEFFENGGFEHGHAFYQGVVSVPLVVAGVDPARLRDPHALVGQMDVAPTLLELAGIEGVEQTGGTSLLRPRGDTVLRSQNLLYGGRVGRAVRAADWKLIDIDGHEELYDLAADPEENTNLVAEAPQAEQLRELLPPVAGHGEAVAPTRAEREALEVLGYLE